MFIKDEESGVRKVDFYNYVTEHLGRIGYRDVWHILKIAYPHVDRVRRGRKYMYWGIRHKDDKIEQLNASLLENDIHCTDKIKTSKNTEKYNNSADDGKNIDVKNSTNNNNTMCINNNNNTEFNNKGYKLYSNTNIEGSNNKNTDVINENRNKSSNMDKQNKLSSSNYVAVKAEQFSDDEERNKTEDFLVIEFKEKDVFESFEDYEKSREYIGKDIRCLTPPREIFTEKQTSSSSLEIDDKKAEETQTDNNKKEDDSVCTAASMLYQSHKDNDIFAPNLLKPENINRVCIPLIHDAKKPRKKDEVTNAKKTSFNPVIVSVESIAECPTNHRKPNHSSDNSQSTDQSNHSEETNEGELKTVVVQDRGIQVCESNSENTPQRRKRKPKDSDCTKNTCPNKNEPANHPAEHGPKSRKRLKKDKAMSGVSATSTTPTIPLAPEGKTVKATHVQQRQSINTPTVVRVPTLALPSLSRGYTAPSSIGSVGASVQAVTLLSQPLKYTSAIDNTAAAMTTQIRTSRVSNRNFKRTEPALNRTRHDHMPYYKNNASNSETLGNQGKARSIQDHVTHQNTATRPVDEQRCDDYRNRELIRKLLEEHESRRNSSTYSTDNDLQVMVDCLSAEVEKERTLRLRLEIELRKVENQLDQERKLNERLAALLMKR